MSVQSAEAIVLANQSRARRRDVRAGLQHRDRSLLDVLSGPDPALTGMTLIEVVAMARSTGMRSAGLARIGEDAMHARVNLMLPVERASERQRLWAARAGARGLRRQS